MEVTMDYNLISISLTFITLLMTTSNAQVVVGVLTTAQKQTLLNMHNDARNTVANGDFVGNSGNLPSATNMNELLWV